MRNSILIKLAFIRILSLPFSLQLSRCTLLLCIYASALVVSAGHSFEVHDSHESIMSRDVFFVRHSNGLELCELPYYRINVRTTVLAPLDRVLELSYTTRVVRCTLHE
jgi:hypothetical protein